MIYDEFIDMEVKTKIQYEKIGESPNVFSYDERIKESQTSSTEKL